MKKVCPLRMAVIYTNLENIVEINMIYNCAEKIEKEHLVVSVVVCSQ